MPDTAVAQLPLFPFDTTAASPFDPLTDADRERLTGPVTRVRLPTGGWAWLVTRHADVREMLRHPGFSADLGRPGFPLLRPLPPAREQDRRGAFLRMDGAEHARFRRMLTAEFMIKRIRHIEPLIHRTVVDSLEAMRRAGSPADLIESFALPVPSMVICHLLGVPYRDHAFFQAHSRTLVDRDSDADTVRAAAGELRDYVHGLVAEKRAAGERSDDLIGRLITERVDTGELSEGELVGVSLLLLIAGHETTANMIGLSTLLLLSHPEHLAALRSNPELAPGMVEELLRYLTIVRTGLPRLAIEDVEIGGQAIRAGEGAIAMLSLANRDPEVFSTAASPAAGPAVAEGACPAEEFDPYRESRQHIAFGFGVHQCIGQPLARAELRVALVELARRFPNLRGIEAPADLPRRDTSIVYGLAKLPVTW